MNTEIILKTNNLGKKYGENLVLHDINFSICKGECHAVVGENGAGKTTLMNILGGIIHPSFGNFEFYGKTYQKVEPRQSIDIGISIIHQDFALVPTLSVKENIFLSKLKGNALGIIQNYSGLEREARKILERLNVEDRILPSDLVGNLSTSHQQIVEIAKALSENPKLLIMDEPTTSLTKSEVKRLFRIINTIKNEGISIIYVSHILEEVQEISDRITVLRDGGYVGTKVTYETDIPEIISMMVGRKIDLYQVKDRSNKHQDSKVVLEVNHLTVDGVLHDINFQLHEGEILGFAGLVGSGRSEVAKALFGLYRQSRGKIIINGKNALIQSPEDAMSMGIGLLPEDRRMQGMIPTMTVLENMSLACLRSLSKIGITPNKKENELAKKYLKFLNIKTYGVNTPITSLSGGNQQKVILAKWLATNSIILIVDEPTQGIDVGSKSEIHAILKSLAEKGVSIILISSELPEIMSLSDRILVMKQGAITGTFDIENATQEKIMFLATIGCEQPAQDEDEKAREEVCQ